MKKKKLLSVLSASALALSLLAPIASKVPKAEATTVPNWNVERYGDRVDIDGQLNQLSKDTSFLQKAINVVKEQASKINFDETLAAEETASTSSFTYDGGTKFFLNRELAFKSFTLRSVGENVEIWVANDLAFPDTRPVPVVTQEQVDKLRDEFDSNIYPKATDFFGTPDTLDGSNSLLEELGFVPEGYYTGNNKVIMLVDNIIDEGYFDPTYPFFVAGFFWQTLETYTDRNMVTIDTNSWETRLENTFFGTTIHELQHLIQADNDGDEESWINEGLSTFSEVLGGYGHDAGSINFYLDHPENSLVAWDEHAGAGTGPETIADYGQVQLFNLYMNDKLGKDFIRALAVNEENGVDGVNAALKEFGSKLEFTKLYQNFITAVALDSNEEGKGLYNIDSIDLRALPVDAAGTKRGKTVDYEKAVTFEKEGVPAWGGDFKKLDFKDKVRSISFDGVDFLPIEWKSVTDPKNPANSVLWGNQADEADNTLIFEADLSGLSSATLKFDNYIDIEEQWDFGVVQVSTDGGQTWTSLGNEHTRTDVVAEGYPKIKANLPGFTGTYAGWQPETFDLSSYAGQKVLVSFRYLTDWGSTQAGWFVDNIQIPEIGFSNDGSSTDAFKSLPEVIGQYVNYTVTFINEEVRKGKETKYKVITVDPFNVTDSDALNLKTLFSKDGNNYMITSYAAPTGDKNSVDFTYEIHLKKDEKKNKKKNKK